MSSIKKEFFLYLNSSIRAYIYSFMIGSKEMLRITETPVNSFREIQIIFRHDWSWRPPYFHFVINEIVSAFVS